MREALLSYMVFKPLLTQELNHSVALQGRQQTETPLPLLLTHGKLAVVATFFLTLTHPTYLRIFPINWLLKT